ncbi:MAG: DUF2283 domain-containing protein [Anaerolineae bacterium]
METTKLEVRYYDTKDTLYLRILPKRPARMAETDYDFYIRYDWDDPDKIVGFEWLDFSRYFNAIDEPGVIPDLPMCFDVVGTELKGATLKEVLRWAYQKYVLKEEMAVRLTNTANIP